MPRKKQTVLERGCLAPVCGAIQRGISTQRAVLSMGFLREEDDGAVNFLLDNVLYKDRDFVLIDESHNLRHRTRSDTSGGAF